MLFQYQTQQYVHGYNNLNYVHGCFSITCLTTSEINQQENNWKNFRMYMKKQNSGFYPENIIYGNTLDSNYQNWEYDYSRTDIVEDI